MIESQVNRQLTYTITLTEKQLHMLQAMVQNPITENESNEELQLRTDIFNIGNRLEMITPS